jgi:general secretion pathway protein F
MAVFSYKGITSKGKDVSGVIEAPTKSAAFTLLKNKGIYPTEIVEESKGGRRELLSFIKRGPKTGELIVFFKTLATLLESGIPIVEAVDSFSEDEEKPHLKVFFKKVVNLLKEGNSLSDALKEAGLNDPVVLSLISSGEKSALISKNLLMVASLLEKRESIKSKLLQALIYPSVLLLVSLGVVVFMLFSVIPKIKAIYTTARVELPFSTKFLLTLSSFIINYYSPIVLAAVLFSILLFILVRRNKFTFDKLKLKLPVLGELLLLSELTKFFMTFGDLLSSGISAIDSYRTALETVTNEYLKRQLFEKLSLVERGVSLSEAFSQIKFIPKVAVQILRAGESSGSLSEMSIKISNYFNEEVEQKIKILTSLLEPVTMLIVGLIIGFIVYALLLPILSISTIRPV